MGKTYQQIDDTLAQWIGEQHLYFVATAPLSADGLVNCSPKGGRDTFAIIDPHTVAYLDLTGSGVETIAHLKENGRITVMFCAMNGAPKILRLYGKGTPIEPHHPDFAKLKTHFPDNPSTRSIIRVDVQRIADSCGFGVPRYDYIEERDTLTKHAENLGPAGIAAYQAENNQLSLDGLPGVEVATNAKPTA